MRIRNGFSTLMLFQIVLSIIGFVFFSIGYSRSNENFIILAFILFAGVIVVRILRYIYKD